MTEMTAAAPRLMQRMGALQRANEVRLGRAALKRRLEARELTAVDLLAEIPEYAEGWALGEMLIAQPRWGGTRVRKFCARNMVSETKPLSRLTDRQRRLLSDQLCRPQGRLQAQDLPGL